MMTEQLAFNVIAAPLAAIDRRTLSQAWYSSLHVVRARESHAPAKPAAGQPCGVLRKIEPPAARASVSPRQQKAPAARGRGPDERPSISREAGSERRVSRSPLARSIERAFLDPRATGCRATFCVGSSRARVYVAMQRIGGTLHLVAIAPGAVRAEVAGALEEARYGLAKRGIAISVALAEGSRER